MRIANASHDRHRRRSSARKIESERVHVAGTNQGGLLVRVIGNQRGQAAINRYLDTYRSFTALATTPTSLINFGEAVNFPLILGAMLAAFGAATLAHFLVVSVARRRREASLLKVLGFVRTQITSLVSWQATTVALVGVVVGVPLGVIVGRAVWLAFANDLGAVPLAVVPIWLIGVVIAGVIVVADLLALGPGLAAAQARPGQFLREQ